MVILVMDVLFGALKMKNKCSVIIGFLGIVLIGNIFLRSDRVFAKTELQLYNECVTANLYPAGFDRTKILPNVDSICSDWAKATAMGRSLMYNPTFLNVNSNAGDPLSPEVKIERVGDNPKVKFYLHSFLYNADTIMSVEYRPNEFYWDKIYVASPSTKYAQLSDWGMNEKWDVYSGIWPPSRWGVVSPVEGKKSPTGLLDVEEFIKNAIGTRDDDTNEMVYTGDLRLHWCLDTTRPRSGWGFLTYPQCDDVVIELTLRVKQPELQLRGVAIDLNGNVIEGVSDVTGITRDEGGEVTITRRNIGGYTFLGWKSDKNPQSSFLSTDAKYTAVIKENTIVYAVYEKGLDNSTLIDLLVKNDDIKNNGHDENYSKYDRKEVYAKPDDKVRYKAVYYPLIQKQYGTMPEGIGIICNLDAPDDAWATYDVKDVVLGNFTKIETLFKNNLDKICGSGFSSNAALAIDPWNNAFGINFSTNSLGIKGEAYTFERGKVCPANKNEECNKNSKKFEAELPSKKAYTVQGGDVGKDLTATTKFNTEFGKEINYTPTQIVYRDKLVNGKYYNVGFVYLQDKNRVAYARVPYNFDTVVSVGGLGENVLAGNPTSIKIIVKSGDKGNRRTVNKNDSKKTYHTKIDGPSIRLIAYQVPEGVSVNTDGGDSDEDESRNLNLCDHYTDYTDTCQIIKSMDIKEINDTFEYDEPYNIPDDWAGTKICFAAAVYPANSGADENIEANGSKTWRVSKSSCSTLGKQPVFQVWGGSVYTSGDIHTLVTKKLKVGDDGNFVITSSWAEQSVISNAGVVEGLASGAATGLRRRHENVESEPVAGSIESKNTVNGFCIYRVPLSISNYNEGKCKGDDTSVSASVVTGASGIDVKKPDVDLLISALENYKKYEQNSMGDIAIDKMEDGWCGKTICVWKQDSGNITISKDIKFPDDNDDNEHIRKAIIYAKEGSILIKCDVMEVDAILVAKEGIKTCVDNDGNEPDYNAEVRSHRLIIKGAVITDGELRLGRTYGAGKGKYSSIPAEIINYDSSIVLWWRDMLQSTKGNTFSEVYQKVLAPRY